MIEYKRNTFGLVSASESDYAERTKIYLSEILANVFSMITLPFRIILYPFKWVFESLFYSPNSGSNSGNSAASNEKKKDYNVNIADENFSDGEIYAILRLIGARFDEIKNKPDVPWIFNDRSKLFDKETRGIKDYQELVEGIVEFCCSFYILGVINPNAIKTTILGLLKNLRYDNEKLEINQKIILPVFENQNSRMGVLRLELDGYQQLTRTCCYDKTKTKLTVKITDIVFHDAHDLKFTLKKIIKLYRLNE